MRSVVLVGMVACNTCPTPKLMPPSAEVGEDALGPWVEVSWFAQPRMAEDWWTSVEVVQASPAIGEVVATGPGVLEVRVEDEQTLLEEGAILALQWGDPRLFMSCDHPGMDDRFTTALVLEPREGWLSAWFTGLGIERGVL